MSTLESPAAPASRTSPASPAVVAVPAHLLASRAAKVRDHHLTRKAIVYIRQSTPQQVARAQGVGGPAVRPGRPGRRPGLAPRPRRGRR